MSFNKSPLAFDDIKEIFEKALGAEKGVKIPCSTRGAAFVLRSRLNYYRKLDRDQNRQVYTRDNPMFGRSVYDKLVLRIPSKNDPEEAVLYIERRSLEKFDIQEI